MARVSPSEAQALISEGYTVVDVRSEAEFALAHIPGAANVPWQQPALDRLVDNPDFLTVMRAQFPKTCSLLLACASGARSAAAAACLLEAGYLSLADLDRGFCGARDHFGRRLPGWVDLGLPQTRLAAPERCYAHLRRTALLET